MYKCCVVERVVHSFWLSTFSGVSSCCMLSGSFCHETGSLLGYLPFKHIMSADLRSYGCWQGVFAPLYHAGGG